MKEIFILADSFNREIVLTKYPTYQKAYEAMKRELDYALGFDSTNDRDAKANYLERGIDYDIDDWSAWANVDGDQNDWVIEVFDI